MIKTHLLIKSNLEITRTYLIEVKSKTKPVLFTSIKPLKCNGAMGTVGIILTVDRRHYNCSYN